MRKLYRAVLRNYFSTNLFRTRTTQGYTQSEMAGILAMDDRSYIDLDHGKTCCSAVTLALYLTYCCQEPAKFIEGLRHAFETEVQNVA